MENTGVARTDLMVAGCAVPFSIVGFQQRKMHGSVEIMVVAASTRFVLFFFILLAGCMYGNEISTSATMVSSTKYPPSSVVEVFFDDNGVHDYGMYSQLAFIEVKGEKWSAMSQLLEEMKKKAASIGADAVIGIKQHYITRERGEILAEILNPSDNKPENYSTIALTGIAIKYE